MMQPKKRTTLWLLGALTLLIIGVFPVLAAPVKFKADTSGQFGAGSSGGTVGVGGDSLTIGGTTVTFTSKPNELNVGLEPGESSNVTLGIFNASSVTSSSFNGATFTLKVSFTLPNDGSPNPGVYTGTLTGTVHPTASGASVVWATQTLTFTSPTAGTFTLKLEPSTPINAPSSPDASRIRGTITYNAPIPEPLTLITMGTGLAGLAAVLRRRKQNP